MINPLIFIIFFKILVIVVGEKCLPGPKLGCEIQLPFQNQAIRCAYRSETCLSNMHTSPILVGEIQSPAYSSLNITEIRGNNISPTGFGPVIISDSRGLDQYALLTGNFWTGNHISQLSFGPGQHFSPTTITLILQKIIKIRGLIIPDEDKKYVSDLSKVNPFTYGQFSSPNALFCCSW